MTSTMTFTGNNVDAARFVANIVTTFDDDSLSITIITRGLSEDCSVIFATEESLADTVLDRAKNYSLQLINISQENTQDG